MLDNAWLEAVEGADGTKHYWLRVRTASDREMSIRFEGLIDCCRSSEQRSILIEWLQWQVSSEANRFSNYLTDKIKSLRADAERVTGERDSLQQELWRVTERVQELRKYEDREAAQKIERGGA